MATGDGHTGGAVLTLLGRAAAGVATQGDAGHVPARVVGGAVGKIPAATSLTAAADVGTRLRPAVSVWSAIRKHWIGTIGVGMASACRRGGWGAAAPVERVIHALHQTADGDHAITGAVKGWTGRWQLRAERNVDADEQITDIDGPIAVAIADASRCLGGHRRDSDEPKQCTCLQD